MGFELICFSFYSSSLRAINYEESVIPSIV